MTTRLTSMGHRARRLAVVLAAVATAGGFLVPATADAAPAPQLSATVTPGNPTVRFTGSAPGGRLTGDTTRVCFGDETAACNGTNGTAVATFFNAFATTHTYAAAGTYTARSFVTELGTVYPSATVVVTVTKDPRAVLAVTTSGLTATLSGTGSTALNNDTWWACFGDHAGCTATAPDLHGTVSATLGVLPSTSHSYASAGTYPASLTITGPYGSDTAATNVTVSDDPTAVLNANVTSGPAPLDVTFNANGTVAGAGDTWALCYGDNAACTQASPDLSGAAPVVLPTTAHTYATGHYTATLYVTKGAQTSTAAQSITSSNTVPAPDATCTLAGRVRTCDLYAMANGSVTVGAGAAAHAVPFWGFSLTNSAPRLGGPRLVATEGETLTFTVHNNLDPKAGPVAITVPGLSGTAAEPGPDLTGVAAGATGASASFTLTRPGTYIYESGPTDPAAGTDGGERQVAMGLSGVLVVRPSQADPTHCAYDSAVAAASDCGTSALNHFDTEKVLAVQEIDPEFHDNPFGADTAEYHPTYFFVDGVAFDPAHPALDPAAAGFDPALNSVKFDASAGQVVLVRYANLGLREHALNLVNLGQTDTARDGAPLAATAAGNTEFLNAGQTADAFVTIPADATVGTRYPMYEAGLHLNNDTVGGLRGMYSYLDVTASAATVKDTGPLGSDVSAAPDFGAPNASADNSQIPDVAVDATFDARPSAAGAATTVSSARWALDAVPPTASSAGWHDAAGSYGAAQATAHFTVQATDLAALLAAEPNGVFGDHTIWLQAVGSNGVAGPPIGATFTLAMRDALISGLSITPSVTNGNTNSGQLPVAATKVATAAPIPATSTSLPVASIAGFPSTCDNNPEVCQITVGLTIASGPSSGQVVYRVFSYTSVSASATTPPAFVGLTPAAPLGADPMQFLDGNTVALDSIPSGFVGVRATATASIPGWVVSASQTCLVLAHGGTPTAAEAIDTSCAGTPTDNSRLSDLHTGNPGDAADAVAPLVPVYGYFAPPTLPSGAPDSAKYFVLVRAQEGPDTADCSVAGSCRWSPWVYYDPATPPAAATAIAGTYDTLTVVVTGPTTSNLAVSPTPNNGFDAAAGNLGLFDSFDVTATVTSPWTNLALAEAFIAPAGSTTAPPQCVSGTNTPAGCVVFGQGAEMTTATGLWSDKQSENVTAFLPLSELQGRPDGLVTVYVHGKDDAGNWGGFQSVALTLDKTSPVIDSATGSISTTVSGSRTLPANVPTALTVQSTAAFPATGSIQIRPFFGAAYQLPYSSKTATSFLVTSTTTRFVSNGTAVSLGGSSAPTVVAHDVVANGVSSGVSRAEWFVGADPGPGNGTVAVTTPATIPSTPNSNATVSFTMAGIPANQTVNVRVVDLAGNWSTAVSFRS